ncbi:UNVERIFIED_CONTAM: RNA-directed DNA polymerase [Sesamum indicum]
MQFEKGRKRNEPSYLCTLRFEEIEETSGPIPGEIKKLLRDFEDVMPNKLPRKLPQKSVVDHGIELVPGTKHPARAPYRMSQPELLKLRKQLKEMLESGIIKPTKSPYGAPVLFQKKADGSLRMCCDYRALNKITVKNKYPIPFVADCFDRLSWANYFTKIDLRSGYWQVQIKEGDEAKMKVVTSGTLAEHVNHLRQGTLWREGVFGDPKKVQAIEDWQPPSDVHHLRSFLGLVNYYWRFVKGYSEIARPLTNLLKKTETWNWTPLCQVAFDDLKKAMVTDPVLALPDMLKSLVVETDTSDYALGGVLMQDGHPDTFGSRKLKDVEWRYSVHGKELLAVVHYLILWQCYLLGLPSWSGWTILQRLSRRAGLASLESIAALSSSAVATSVRDRVRELLSSDPATQGLIQLVEQGKQLWLEDGLVMTKRNRVYVLKSGDLRKSLISECHRTPRTGAHLRLRAEGLLLATDAGRCGDLCPHLLDMTAGQALKHITVEGTAHLFVDIARSYLDKAQKRMKKYADQNRRFIEFNAGDHVMVKVPDPRLSKSSRGRDPRLMQKYVGPLSIIRRIGTVAYKVELPSWWKIHNVFHVR